MKMHDLGQTNEERYGKMEATSLSEDKDKKFYDHIMITDKQLPNMEGKHAGDKVMMVVECHIKSVTKNEDDKNNKTEYKLELRKIGLMSKEHKEINPYKKSDEE